MVVLKVVVPFFVSKCELFITLHSVVACICTLSKLFKRMPAKRGQSPNCDLQISLGKTRHNSTCLFMLRQNILKDHMKSCQAW